MLAAEAAWAHVRRRFYELAQAGPAPIASEALQRIAELYNVEAAIRGRRPDERQATRQEKSRPIIEALDPWSRAKLALISQKTKLAEAIRYALSRWEGLSLFLDDGCVELDNNIVERSIRPWPSPGRMRSSPAPTVAPNTGPSSPRWSRPTCVDGLRGARVLFGL